MKKASMAYLFKNIRNNDLEQHSLLKEVIRVILFGVILGSVIYGLDMLFGQMTSYLNTTGLLNNVLGADVSAKIYRGLTFVVVAESVLLILIYILSPTAEMRPIGTDKLSFRKPIANLYKTIWSVLGLIMILILVQTLLWK